MLIRYDGDGSQTQEVRLWKEGRRTNDVIWVVVVVLVVTREPERRGRDPSDSILFCELLRLPVSAASLQDGPHPRARSLVCGLGWDPGSELYGLEALQPRHVETSSHFHCGFDTICLEQLREVVFFLRSIRGCDGGKFCALKFKRPPTPLNIGSTRYAGLRRQDQRYKISIQLLSTSTLAMVLLCWRSGT